MQQGQCGSWPEAVELVSLLSRYEVEGLLYAHDRIAEASTISTAPLSGGHHEVPDINHHHQHSNSADYGMPESAFISSTSLTGYSPAHSAHSGHSSQTADRTFKIIRLEKSNEPLVMVNFAPPLVGHKGPTFFSFSLSLSLSLCPIFGLYQQCTHGMSRLRVAAVGKVLI